MERQRGKFPATHQISKDCETENKLAQTLAQFMKDYNPEHCYGLVIGMVEV